VIDIGFYNMDCFIGMKDIDDESIDMILCDPPYGTTQCEWDIALPLAELWKQYSRIIKNNGAILIFSQQPFTTDLIESNRKMFRYEIIWEKTLPTGFLNAAKAPLRAHENICVFYKKAPTYNAQMTSVRRNDVGRTRTNGGKAKQYNEFRKEDWSYTETGLRYPTDVIQFSNWNGALFGNTNNATKHPTQKPIQLLEYLINTYTNVGDIILDNCAGSCSTGIAAHNTGRRFIGFEKNREIYTVGKERYENEKAQLTLFDMGMLT
jgi:site-specific DNA-methyltransferase (adenine-specific)